MNGCVGPPQNYGCRCNKYEDYTRFVKEDMFKETYNFVHYVLEQDLSILEFHRL